MSKDSLLLHRFKFIALVLIFASPFIAGWMALYVFELKPESINYGTLVQPVKKLQWPVMKSVTGERFENGFGQKWTFLLITREACTKQCQSNLFYMRQIRTLLGRNTPRLQNVLVMTNSPNSDLSSFLGDYPNLIVIENSSDILNSQFQVTGAGMVGSTPRLYLVDPDKNYMMHYPAQFDHYRVLDDIKKLMKLSQIG